MRAAALDEMSDGAVTPRRSMSDRARRYIPHAQMTMTMMTYRSKSLFSSYACPPYCVRCVASRAWLCTRVRPFVW